MSFVWMLEIVDEDQAGYYSRAIFETLSSGIEWAQKCWQHGDYTVNVTAIFNPTGGGFSIGEDADQVTVSRKVADADKIVRDDFIRAANPKEK